jgi:hypothetical protein
MNWRRSGARPARHPTRLHEAACTASDEINLASFLKNANFLAFFCNRLRISTRCQRRLGLHGKNALEYIRADGRRPAAARSGAAEVFRAAVENS